MISNIKGAHKKIILILFAIVLVVISNGQTLKMYFWQDDSALIFKLQNIEGEAGSFGKGPFGSGPYKYLATPFIPFYPIFKLDPFGYFLIGLLLYIIATLTFYLFTSELFQNRLAAYFSTLIFAAGYIGSDVMFRIINSWQSNIGLILALLSFWAYIKYLRNTGKYILYLLAIIFFYLSVELVFIRSHSLIFIIVTIDFLLSIYVFKLTNLIKLFLRQIPFFLIFFLWYIKGNSSAGPNLTLYLQSLLDGHLETSASLFASIGNVLLPDIIQNRLAEQISAPLFLLIFSVLSWLILTIFKASRRLKIISLLILSFFYLLNEYLVSLNLYWYRDKNVIFSGALGFYFTTLVSLLTLIFWQKQRIFSLSLALGWIIIASQIFGYYTAQPTIIFNTTQRYLIHSFIGYAVLYGILFFAFYQEVEKRKNIFLLKFSLIPLMVIVLMNSTLSFNYQSKVVRERSTYAKHFFNSLKSYIPKFEKGSVFYFDVSQDSLSRGRFNNSFGVGSMPESTAIAIYYYVDRYDLLLVTDYDDLLSQIKKNNIPLSKIYTFYYNQKGLFGTSDLFQRLMKQSTNKTSSIEAVYPLTPILVTFEAKANMDKSKVTNLLRKEKEDKLSKEEKIRMLNYIEDRNLYYKTVSVASLSNWKFHERDKVIDNNPDTHWWGHRIFWHDNKKESLVIDLKKQEEVSKILWVNSHPRLTPLSYNILSSQDGINWELLKKVSNGGEKNVGEITVEEVPNVLARYIKIEFTKTISDDSPSMAEVEVIKAQHDGLDILQAIEYAKHPFKYLEDENELNQVLQYAPLIVKIKAGWKTDQDSSFKVKYIPLIDLYSTHDYQIILDAGGTKLEDFKLEIADAPLSLEVSSLYFRNLSFDELDRLNMIKILQEN